MGVLNLQPKKTYQAKSMKVTLFKLLAIFAIVSPTLAITDEQEAAIARLKLLMEKLSSIKRSYPFMEAQKRGDDSAASAEKLSNYMNLLDETKQKSPSIGH